MAPSFLFLRAKRAVVLLLCNNYVTPVTFPCARGGIASLNLRAGLCFTQISPEQSCISDL